MLHRAKLSNVRINYVLTAFRWTPKPMYVTLNGPALPRFLSSVPDQLTPKSEKASVSFTSNTTYATLMRKHRAGRNAESGDRLTGLPFTGRNRLERPERARDARRPRCVRVKVTKGFPGDPDTPRFPTCQGALSVQNQKLYGHETSSGYSP